MKPITLHTRWNLDNLYNQYSLNDFITHLAALKSIIQDVEEQTTSLNLSEAIKQIEKAESFYYCLTAEDMDSSVLTTIQSLIYSLKSRLQIIISNQSKENKAPEDELLNKLSSFTSETLKGYEDLYTQVRSNLKVKVDFGEGEKELTFNEANHLALTHQSSLVRKRVFDALNHTLKTQSNVFGSIYNQIVGRRIDLYKEKGQDFLEDSLIRNGLSSTALKSMWNEIDAEIPNLVKFLKGKAGHNKISWHELMSSSQEVPYQISFSEAVDQLRKALEQVDTEMSNFVLMAVMNRWVDAEPSQSKPSGGFCAPFIDAGESRISLNYDSTIDSARILAHELGHAWHFKQLDSSSSPHLLEDRFEMTVAETASIFFESAFIDYVIQDTKDNSLKKALIGWKSERSFNYLMSIRGAFLFEQRFLEKRGDASLTSQQIEELSLKAQEEVYGGSLNEYQPYVWIKYIQFYRTEIPFYNYPYTFGFLLSIGLLELSKIDKEQFPQKYKTFLSQTGIVPVETLVKELFNIDLSQPKFWRQAIQKILEDIKLYLKL
ncbi:M3 family metallopeptidase [Fictibacillus sp. B-59209]|uniref:M3 family metallopeptidase n=1 Tax=Fictibacillus sp. B-59209 TaxID=3024873 RepID=UPI002E1AE2C3|nr:M3 family metallopeptidase [Fictibacillus sp. B-59209]